RVLILDEPTAVLTPQEVDELFGVLRTLRDQGTAIVLITHKLAEVAALADRVTVMRAGRVVGGGPAREFTRERLAELMVGRVPAPLGERVARVPGPEVLEGRELLVHDARGLPAVRRVSLSVRAGGGGEPRARPPARGGARSVARRARARGARARAPRRL